MTQFVQRERNLTVEEGDSESDKEMCKCREMKSENGEEKKTNKKKDDREN